MLAKLHFNISNPHRCISHQRCTRVCIVFSSACDIVSGAFLIPSRPSSVVRRLSSSTFFSNRIGPSVVIRSCRYLAWMCITMLGKNLWNYNFAFMLLIFLWIFNYKKLGILELWGHRLPQLSSDLSDIWLECAQQYCPQNCETRILYFKILFICIAFTSLKY